MRGPGGGGFMVSSAWPAVCALVGYLALAFLCLWVRETRQRKRTEVRAKRHAQGIAARDEALLDFAKLTMPSLLAGTPGSDIPAALPRELLDSSFARSLALLADTGERTGQSLQEAWERAEQATWKLEFARREPSWRQVVESLTGGAQALADRCVRSLTALERQVEDPELLEAVFVADHQVVLLRRRVQNMAVIASGGRLPHEQSHEEVSLATVLRLAVAEATNYQRLQVTHASENLLLPGHVARALTRLIAELADNGLQFSPESEQVTVEAASTADGLVVRVRDRGLSIGPAQQDWLTDLLESPQSYVDDQLKRGQIGLLVCGLLAQRHDLTVSCLSAERGTLASVLVPQRFLLPESVDDLAARLARQPAATASRGLSLTVSPTPSAAIAAPVPGKLPKRIRRTPVSGGSGPLQQGAMPAAAPPAALAGAGMAAWINAVRGAGAPAGESTPTEGTEQSHD